MPQMAPINWLSLYFMFILIFIMFIIMNYFMFLYPPKSCKTSLNKKQVFWKW